MSKKISECEEVEYSTLVSIDEDEVVCIPGIKINDSGQWTNVRIDWQTFKGIFALAAKLTEVENSLDAKITKCANDISNLDTELRKVLDFKSLEKRKSSNNPQRLGHNYYF